MRAAVATVNRFVIDLGLFPRVKIPGSEEQETTIHPLGCQPRFSIWTSVSRIRRFSCPRHNECATRAGPNNHLAQTLRVFFARLFRLFPRFEWLG